MKTWKHWIIKALKLKGTLDTERALREKQRRILELEKLVEELQTRLGWNREHVKVEIDPVMRARGYALSEWNSEPERHTDKPRVIPQPHGTYFQQRRKEFQTTKLMPIADRPENFLL